MKLFEIFEELAARPQLPFLVIKFSFDREGAISQPNTSFEKYLKKKQISSSANLTSLFPKTFTAKYLDTIFKTDKTETITIKNLPIENHHGSFLCLEKKREQEDKGLFIALPFDKRSILKLFHLFSQLDGYYNSNPDLVFSVDEKWRVKDINQAGMSKLGLSSRKQALDILLTDIAILSDTTLEFISDEIRKGHVLNDFEIFLKDLQGNHITGSASIFGLAPTKENRLQIFFHIKDETLKTQAFSGQVQLNMELTELNEELNQAYASILSQEKMAALGLLAAGMAHEINNPLGFIFNNVSVLMNHIHDIKSYVANARHLYSQTEDPRIMELQSLDEKLDLDYIFQDASDIEEENHEGIERIKNILNSLKSFARKDKTEDRAYYDLNEAVQDTLIIAKNEYKYIIDIHEEYGEAKPFLCFAAEINLVLLNLLINSIEAIQTQPNRSGRGNIWLKTSQDQDFTYFTIKDDGPGISNEVKRKIYDPFFTTKSAGGGTGLGLTLVHDIIVNRHKGNLQIEDNDPGATFIVAVPRNPEMTEEEI